MPFQIIRDDITKVEADVIVNTANPMPTIGGGTDSAIYNAAGVEKLLAARQEIGPLNMGEMAVTPAFNLNAKYIFHVVGPVWDGGNKGEYDILSRCYRGSLEKAVELGCESIAFPLIATGTYGFPKDQALQIAMNVIGAFLMEDDVELTVTLVVFDDKAFRLSRNLFFEVESFIDDEDVIAAHRAEYGEYYGNDIYRRRSRFERDCAPYYEREFEADFGHVNEAAFEEDSEEGCIGGGIEADMICSAPVFASCAPSVKGKPFDEHTFDKNEFMDDDKKDSPFQQHFLKLIIASGLDNTTIYKSSNITKNAFSKIICGDTKIPKKTTVLCFCIGLRLSVDEAKDLLASADMAFNPYDKRDKLIIQCLEHGQYNINEINSMLYICNQPLLGNVS